MAAIARMRFAAADPIGAAQAYSTIFRPRILCSLRLRDQFLGATTQHVAALLRGDSPAEAASTAESALDQLSSLAGSTLRPTPSCRRGDPYRTRQPGTALAGRYTTALSHLVAAGAALTQAGDPAPYQTVGQYWRGCIGSPRAYSSLADHAAYCLAEAPGSSGAPVADAARECQRYLDDYLGLSASPDESLREMGEDPVRVTLRLDLLEGDVEARVVSGVGDMRARIRDSRGVTVRACTSRRRRPGAR